MQALLGIDLGTTGIKAALFSTDDGRVLADAFREYPFYHPHPGWAEQDPAEWWQPTLEAIRACLSQGQDRMYNQQMCAGLASPDKCMVWSYWMSNIRYYDHVLSGPINAARLRAVG